MKRKIIIKNNCSTFMLKDEQSYLIGHNLDNPDNVPGGIFINRRGVQKRNISFQELISGVPPASPSITWVARYGSITFNTAGKEFIDGGINEAGLFIQEMTLRETEYPLVENKPTFFMQQWMQYVLDNYSSLDELLAGLEQVSIDGWPWHFFTADRSGAVAVIQFIAGKTQIYTGDGLPYPLLCNAQYPQEIKNLKQHSGFGGDQPLVQPGSTIEEFGPARFPIGVTLMQNKPDNLTVDYAFKILQSIGHPDWTKWSYVIDLPAQEIHFKTNQSPLRKQFSYADEDFSSCSLDKLLNIHTSANGEVGALFEGYTEEQNVSMVDACLDEFTQWEDALAELGGSLSEWRVNMKAYPASTRIIE